MKERWNRIRTSVWITAFVIMGVLEYVQLMVFFDLPQMLLVMPLIGAFSFILLKKASFAVPFGPAVLSCVFQIVAGDSNAVSALQTDVSGVARILFSVLPVCLLFQVIGIGAGALVCVLLNRKQKTAVGIVCLLLGILLALGPYVALYRNPLYPVQARVKLHHYVNENYNDYQIAEKRVYFDINTSTYHCRVIMVDGAVRLASLDADGSVREEN